MRRSLTRAQARLRDERGMALVMAVGTLLVLTIGLTAVIELTGSAGREAHRVNADQKAYALAERGINDAVSVLFASTNVPPQSEPSDAACANATSPWYAYKTTLPPRQTPSTVGATEFVVWSGTLDCAAGKWIVTATGSVANPTGPAAAPVTSTARVTVPLLTTLGAPSGPTTALPYGGAYFFAKNGHVWAKGNTSIEVPIFASGNLDFVGGPTGPATASTWIFPIARLINVGGYVKPNAIGLIGQPTTALETAIGDGTSGAGSSSINATGSTETLFNSQATLKLMDPSDPTRIEYFKYSSRSSGGFAGSGFERGYGGKDAPTRKAWPVGTIITGALEIHAGLGCSPDCTPANKVWASNAQPDTSVLPMPTFTTPDMAALYTTAAPGPTVTASRPRTCTGTPPVFDNNTVLDHSAGSVASPIDLAPSASYDCTQLAPDGSTGRIKWDGTTLTVRGTVLFDGDIKFGRIVVYDTGSAGATIYTTGGLDLKSAHFCAVKSGSDCVLAGYDPVLNPTGWNPDVNRLGLVAARFTGEVGVTHNFDTVKHVQAMVYCDGTFTSGSGAKFQGLAQCDNIDLREGGSAPSPAVAEIPAGFPEPPASAPTGTTVTLLAPRDFG